MNTTSNQDLGIYYLAREPNQFTTIAPLWEKIGGKFLTWRVRKNLFGDAYPFTWWKSLLFPQLHSLRAFRRQMKNLFPEATVETIWHFYLGPFPRDLQNLICTSMWPVPPAEKRSFKTYQFYHGVSDKRFKVGSGKNEYPPLFDHWDYWMLSGEKDKQKLLSACREAGIKLRPEQLVEIGYLRFDKIINHQCDHRALMAKAGIPDNGRKNILFAPTWRWGGGTLMSHYKVFCDQISREHNLIIRNHINDAANIQIVKNYCRQQGLKNVYFIDDSVMNIIDNMTFIDLLISDSSSVAYDFLIMERPMIFNKVKSKDILPTEKKFDIKRCGYEFDLEKDDILKMIAHSLAKHEFRATIAEVRANCFYYLDGRATERAVKFIREVQKQQVN